MIKKLTLTILVLIASLVCSPLIMAQDTNGETVVLTEKQRKAKEKADKEAAKKAEKKAKEEAKKAEKERKAKEKEAFDWTKMRPSLSGAENMDRYILYCDTMWTRIQSYKENLSFFRLDTIPARDESGEIVYVVKILDEEGNSNNFGTYLQQGLDITLAGTNIVFDVATITLLTTNAGLDLTEKPMLVFTHSKCLKGGPQIISLAYKEVKEIVNATKAQMADIKSMKSSRLEGSTDYAFIIPADDELPADMEILDIANIDLGGSDDGIEVDWDELDNLDLDPV